jgi:hypothetical protein
VYALLDWTREHSRRFEGESPGGVIGRVIELEVEVG